ERATHVMWCPLPPAGGCAEEPHTRLSSVGIGLLISDAVPFAPALEEHLTESPANRMDRRRVRHRGFDSPEGRRERVLPLDRLLRCLLGYGGGLRGNQRLRRWDMFLSRLLPA